MATAVFMARIVAGDERTQKQQYKLLLFLVCELDNHESDSFGVPASDGYLFSPRIQPNDSVRFLTPQFM